MTADDLLSEAWLALPDLECHLGRSVNLADSGDQDRLIDWLSARHGKFPRWRSVRGISINQSRRRSGDESSESTLEDLLVAPSEFQPLTRLITLEEQPDITGIIQRSFSEFSAYLILLVRFTWNLPRLADDLAISVATLNARVLTAQDRTRVQASLFDGICTVDRDIYARASWFRRLRRRWYASQFKGWSFWIGSKRSRRRASDPH